MAGTQSDIQPRVDRSLDLGFLDSFVGSGSLDLDAIVGIDAEMVPVDSFFDSYVDTLGAAAADQQQSGTPSGELLPLTLPNVFHQDGSPQSEEIPATSTISTFSQPLPLPSSALPATPLPEQFLTSGQAASIPVHQPLGVDMEMPSIPTATADAGTAGRGARSTRSARGVAVHATSNISGDDALHHPDHEKTKRNPKQQLQNKQAQQRYRERRKQRFQELEGALNVLADQMNDKQTEVSDLWNKNASFRREAQELSSALQTKEKEAQALRNQVASMQAQLAAAASGGPTSSDGHSIDSVPTANEGELPLTSPGSLSASELAGCREEYENLITAMRQVAEAHSLRAANPFGEGVNPEVLVRVRELVGQGCKSSQALDRKGGIHVLEVMARRADTDMASHTCVQERARWGTVLESLKLAPRQQEALLALRKQHLLRLASIYQDRQHLNMQAMGLMLPGGEACSRAGLSTQMACMSISSYIPSVANTLQLDTVLDQIKGNLREEQKAFMELKLVVLHRVLSPIQALLFVVDAHPSRPDALALSNSVAFKVGRAAEGCPKAAKLLQAQADAAMRKSSGGSLGPGAGSCAGSMEHNSDDSSHRSDSCAAGI